MINSILYSEVSLVCILILLLLCVKVKKSAFLQEQRTLLFWVMVLAILLLIVDAVWIFVNTQTIEPAFLMNWVLNTIYFLITGIMGFTWFAFSETVQESKIMRVKRNLLISMIPVSLLVVLTLTSYWTGWIFYINDNNEYHRGPAYFLQLLCAYGYVIFTASKAIYLIHHTNNYQRRNRLLTIAAFGLPTLLAGFLQVLFPGYPILCVGNTVGILYVYVTLQEQLVSVDALTKLNNRNQLYQYLSIKLSHVREDKELYLLLMDVDYFKSINDQYGHVEGDRALQIVAQCLTRTCNKRNFFLARYGGDEFIMICELEKKDSIGAICESIYTEIENAITKYPLSISIGYAKYTAKIRTQQEFISMADQELYKVKRQRRGTA